MYLNNPNFSFYWASSGIPLNNMRRWHLCRSL